MKKVFVHALLLTLAVLQLCGIAFVDGALSTVVKSGEEECFVVRAPAGGSSTISGNFDCLDDELSPDPIGVSLYNEQKTPIWQSKSGTSEGTFTIHDARSGKYEFCIQNGNMGSDDMYAKQDGVSREVGFAIRVIPPIRGLDGAISGPDDQLTTNLLTMSSKLLTGLHTMSDHQEYMRERENKHRILAGVTFHTVMQWTILEAIILVLIAFVQVLYLRKFFEQRRYL